MTLFLLGMFFAVIILSKDKKEKDDYWDNTDLRFDAD